MPKSCVYQIFIKRHPILKKEKDEPLRGTDLCDS